MRHLGGEGGVKSPRGIKFKSLSSPMDKSAGVKEHCEVRKQNGIHLLQLKQIIRLYKIFVFNLCPIPLFFYLSRSLSIFLFVPLVSPAFVSNSTSIKGRSDIFPHSSRDRDRDHESLRFLLIFTFRPPPFILYYFLGPNLF